MKRAFKASLWLIVPGFVALIVASFVPILIGGLLYIAGMFMLMGGLGYFCGYRDGLHRNMKEYLSQDETP